MPLLSFWPAVDTACSTRSLRKSKSFSDSMHCFLHGNITLNMNCWSSYPKLRNEQKERKLTEILGWCWEVGLMGVLSPTFGVTCLFKTTECCTCVKVKQLVYLHVSYRHDRAELWPGYQAGFGQKTLQKHFQCSSWPSQFRMSQPCNITLFKHLFPPRSQQETDCITCRDVFLLNVLSLFLINWCSKCSLCSSCQTWRDLF